MRNFSKTLISMAAVMAVGSAMAAVMAVGSAMAAGTMAADLTIGKDTVKTDGKISISGVTADKSQYTLLVVQGTTAEGATEVTYNATESTIKQIDQNDAGVAFTEAVVGTDLADGDYKVMVGNNDGTVDEGYFTLSSAPVVEYRDYLIGDINDDTRMLTNDVTYLKKKIAKKTLTEGVGRAGETLMRESGKELIIGDINDDTRMLTNDVTYLKKKIAKKTLTEGVGLAGTTVKVVK